MKSWKNDARDAVGDLLQFSLEVPWKLGLDTEKKERKIKFGEN